MLLVWGDCDVHAVLRDAARAEVGLPPVPTGTVPCPVPIRTHTLACVRR
jgi:hypothetical protein